MPTKSEMKALRQNHGLRYELLDRFDHYMDLPLALASIVMVLLAVIQITGKVSPTWQQRLLVLQTILWALFAIQFIVQFALAPNKQHYLKVHWLNVLVLLVPFLGFLKFLAILRLTRGVSLFRLMVFGSASLRSPWALLKRRRLGQLLLASGLVILLGAAIVDLLEGQVAASPIKNFGDALWWSATIVTTVGSSLDVVTPGGRILGFVLMLYGVGVFSYLTASIASVLVGLDQQSQQASQPQQTKPANELPLTPEEMQALQSILARAQQSNGYAVSGEKSRSS